MNTPKVSSVVGTRFFESDEAKAPASLLRVRNFATAALEAGLSKVLIAVNVAADKSDAVHQTWPENVYAFPVTPWGGFVMPLNALLLAARDDLAKGANLFVASVEVKLTAEAVALMSTELDDQTLVVGAAVMGHQYEKGVHEKARGRQVPWNTLSVWNPKYLWTSGFPMMGDGPIDQPQNKGVEELITIAVIQKLYPEAKAKLMQIPGQSWDTSSFDGDRLAAHEKKMGSKDPRPATQLVAARLDGPTVWHI